MKSISLFGVLLTGLGVAGTANAGVEAIHDRTFRNPELFCQGDPRVYMPSRLGTPTHGFDVTGPGSISFELFGVGVDWDMNDIKIAGSDVTISRRSSLDGFYNNGKACTGVGSVSLTLNVDAVPVDKIVYLEASGARIPIRLHARKLSNIRWGAPTPSGGSMAAQPCLRYVNNRLIGTYATPLVGKIVTDPASPTTLRLTLSPDDLETLTTQCGAASPTDLVVGIGWDREDGSGKILFTPQNEDAVKVTVTRTQLAGSNLPVTTTTPTGSTSSAAVKFKISDLVGFVGTATYEVRLSAASGPPSPPLKLIIDTFPSNGVRTLTFGVPAATSEVRKLRLNYVLHAPAQPGMRLKWSTYAYQLSPAGAKVNYLYNCFTNAEGTSATLPGATTGTVELNLTDAPGCADRTAGITLRLDDVDHTEFNYSPFIGTEHTVELPSYASLKLAKPPVTTSPSIVSPAIKPVLKPGT